MKLTSKYIAFSTLLAFFIGIFAVSSLAVAASYEAMEVESSAKRVKVPTGPQRAAAYYYFTVAQLMIQEQDFAKAITYYEKAIKRDKSSPVLYTDLAYLHIRFRENDQALVYLDKAIELNPDYYTALVLSGELLTLLKMEDRAVERFLRAIEINPDEQKPYMLLSTLYVNRGESNMAIEIFKQLIKVKPTSAVSYYYMGRIEAERNNYSQAIKYLKKVLEINPSFAAGYLELGLIFERQKDMESAIEVYERGIKVAPYDVNLRNRLGQLFIQQDQLDKAVKHFEVISERGSAKLNAIIKIGLIYLELKRYDESIEWFEKALAIKFDAYMIRYYLGATYEEKGDFDKAAAEFEMLPKDDENFVDAKIRLSYIYEQQKNYNEAIIAMNEAIEAKDSDPSLYRLLIGLNKEAGSLTRAMEIAEDAVDLFPDDVDLRFTLGTLCDELNGGLDCLTHMFKAVEMDPSHASALNYIGYTYVENGIKLNEAEVLINRALAASPESGHIMDSLGWLYYIKGDVDSAVTELERAFDKLPNDAIVAEHLGDAYLKQSAKQKAVGVYEKAHKLAPKNLKLENKFEKLKRELNL